MHADTTAVDSHGASPVDVARAMTLVPSAPGVLAKLSQLVRTGSASLSEMGRLVRLDMGLATSILRRAYALRAETRTPCFSIEDAVNFLGLSELHEEVRRVSHTQILVRPLDAYGLPMEDFWRSSVACALSAEILAETTGQDPDMAYTAGLVHAVGVLAIEDWARDAASGLVFAQRGWLRDASAAEGALLGFSNAEVGAVLLRHWDFPSAICEAVRLQYVPFQYGAHAQLTCLLHAAKWLRGAVCGDDGVPPLPEDRYLDAIHLTSYELVRLVVDVRIRLGTARGHLVTKAA